MVVLLCANAAQAQRWQKITLPGNYEGRYYLDVFFLPADQLFGWACDQDSGFVIRTTDGGNSWRGAKLGPNGQRCHLEYVQFLDKNIGYCSGPCGAFKSTDGGATWAALTVATPMPNLWGGWFKSATEGWFTGGGCGVNNFYHTTDGGQNFTIVSDTTIKRSNLSDPLWNSAMPANTVYAIGNGTLWKSTNNGTNWGVESYTGTNSPWHEEISMSGNTICISSASSNCAPNDFTGGSMRTSTDLGSTWSETRTTDDMFGTYLINDSKGWATGLSGNVWYTSNKGATWTLRNCGIGDAHTDDVFFMNDSTGWIAGQGLFRYSRALRIQSDSAKVFRQACPNIANRDTVYISNLNFTPSNWMAGITGVDADQFRIVNSPLSAQIGACVRQPIIIEYLASRAGQHKAMLLVTIGSPDTALTINLSGDRRDRTGYPTDTLIIMNVRVGQTVAQQLAWSATASPIESILLIDRVSGDTSINMVGTIPVALAPPPVNGYTTIRATARDTGWTSARFKVIIGPCLRDTFITVRMYGLSPIISSIASVAIDSKCRFTDTLRIPVSNTGNYQLSIATIRTEALGKNAFKVIGFVSGRTANPYVIPAGVTDTLLVLFTPQTGDDAADVVLEHDDFTTARNVARPLRVALRGVSQRPQIALESNVIDFGKICLNSLAERGWTLSNSGTSTATITFENMSSRVGGFPGGSSVVTSGQTKSYRISFKSATLGVIRDTVWMRATLCDSSQMVIVLATVVDSRIVITPAQIVENVTAGNPITKTAVITIVGTDVTTVTSIVVTPTPPNLVVVLPTLPAVLSSNSSLNVQLTFTADSAEQYVGTITASGTGLCNGQSVTNVKFVNNMPGIYLSKYNVDLVQQCGPAILYDTVMVVNTSNIPSSITPPVILAPAGGFAVVTPTTTSTVEIGKPLSIIVSYVPPARGSNSATMEFADAVSGEKYIVALQGALILSDLQFSVTTMDFGRVETCTPDSVIKFTVTNASDFFETIVVEKINLQPGCSTTPQQIKIPMGETVTLEVRCSPSATDAGISTGTFVIRELRCGEEKIITVLVNNVTGKLTMLPASLRFKTLLPGETDQLSVTISNNTKTSRTIVDLVVDVSSEPFTITPDVRGRLVAPGEDVQVQVVYAPLTPADNNAQLVMTDAFTCVSTTKTALFGIARAYVTPPVYQVNLFVDNYFAAPGTQVKIPVQWKSDVKEALIDTLTTEIDFYELLYNVDTVLLGNLPDAIVTTSFTNGKLKIVVANDGPNMGRPGVVCTMVGTAFGALPDSTGFIFSNSTVTAGESTTIITTPGSLVVDACGPRFLIRLGAPSGFKILPPTPAQYEVQIEVLANIPQRVSVDFINSVGDIIPTNVSESFAAGTFQLSVPISNLANGLYGMRFTTSLGGTYILMLPVVR